MKTSISAVALAILLAAASGSAQLLNKVNAKIPFEFTAAGKVLPAGQYQFTYDAEKLLVTVKGTEKGSQATIPIITLLSGSMHTTPNDSHIVFDKVGSNHYLSELWLSGIDGICLLSTKGKHEHEMLSFPK